MLVFTMPVWVCLKERKVHVCMFVSMPTPTSMFVERKKKKERRRGHEMDWFISDVDTQNLS